MGLWWPPANALAKYGVTANAIMPSGATRMIDSTPRGKQMYKETGNRPSERASGAAATARHQLMAERSGSWTRARPGQRRAAGGLSGERSGRQRQRPGLSRLWLRLHAV